MKKTEERGITLIGLVVTIIVLLILAGVTIVALAGDNGILNNAVSAKNKTEVSSIEELASIEYTSIYANDMTKSEEEIMSGVVQKLNEKGYTTIPDTTENNIIATGFTLSEEYIELVPTTETEGTKSKEIKVNLVRSGENGSSSDYLITINSTQHRMTFQNGKIKIEEEAVQTNVESETYKLTITPTDIVTNGSVILAIDGENITEEKTIDITSTVIITVSSTEDQINDLTDVFSILLKNNLDRQIGEIKNIQIAVEKIYDFTLTSSNYSLAGITREGDVVIPETFKYDGKKYKVGAISRCF